MSIAVGALFTTALGLQAPCVVSKVDLDTAKRWIDFEVSCDARQLPCPACSVDGQGIHDCIKCSSRRHLDFFQFEARLHAEVPQGDCDVCGKTSLVEVPWARPGSGFTLLFEARALSLYQTLPVVRAAAAGGIETVVAAHRALREHRARSRRHDGRVRDGYRRDSSQKAA